MTDWKGAREPGTGEVCEAEVKILMVKGGRTLKRDRWSERTGVNGPRAVGVSGAESGLGSVFMTSWAGTGSDPEVTGVELGLPIPSYREGVPLCALTFCPTRDSRIHIPCANLPSSQDKVLGPRRVSTL